MTDEKKGKGCWVFCSIPADTPMNEDDFHITMPDGTVHRPETSGVLVGGCVDGQDVEFEIKIPGEPNARKVRAPLDTVDVDKLVKMLNS
jgi:hypothetical protein